MEDLAGVRWLNPWYEIDQEKRHLFERVLQGELTVGHPLSGIEATAVARSGQCDDVLYALHGASHPYAVVHLVWQGPQRPPWPDHRFFASLAEFTKLWMEPDHEEYPD